MNMALTFVLWFVLIMVGTHVGYALIMSSIFFFVISDSLNLLPFALEQMFNGVNSQTLLAVPFFIVAGMIASRGKTSVKLVEVMTAADMPFPVFTIISAIPHRWRI